MTDLELNLVRLCGVLGALGSFTILITDWIGWTKPADTEHLLHSDEGLNISLFAEKMFLRGRGIPWNRKPAASWIGAIAMAPTALGYVTMAVLLQPAGPFLAYAATAFMVVFYMGGTFAHPAMGIINGLFEGIDELDRNSEAFAVTAKHIERAVSVFVPIALGMVAASSAIGSLLYSYAVFFADTHYPVWMGFLNIFFITMIFQFRLIPLPWSIARWTAPACVHLFATFPFLVISTILVWNGV